MNVRLRGPPLTLRGAFRRLRSAITGCKVKGGDGCSTAGILLCQDRDFLDPPVSGQHD